MPVMEITGKKFNEFENCKYLLNLFGFKKIINLK